MLSGLRHGPFKDSCVRSGSPKTGVAVPTRMRTLVDVAVPDIGDFKNIPVIEILVKAGDRVTTDMPLVVLESDKATLDVPSPQNGTVEELKIVVGDRVSVGSILLNLEVASELNGSDAPPRVAASASQTATLAEPSPKVVSIRAEPLEPETKVRQTFIRSPHASPSVRRMSREFGIDIAAVRGTGPRGRIVKDDLQQFVKTALSTPSSSNASAAGINIAPWPNVDFSKFGKIERAELSKIRKLSGANLSRNSIVIPHVTNFEDADITDLEAFRATLNHEMTSADAKMTVLPFLIKAAAATLAKFPTFNSSLDGEQLILKQYFHIGFAADTPNGLVVPVIRDVERKGIREIAAEAATLASQAREGKLKSADMQGGCFTISSLGGIGGTGFTPIINAPEVAILGATRAKMQPFWDGKAFIPRLILPLSLSWDHRVVDGVAAARFLVHLASVLGDLRRLSL
jgi:pyruvate dehydrogenase E2 component (dihydrolipoamide acetyltransferase)